MTKRVYKDAREFNEDFIQKFLLDCCLRKKRYSMDEAFNKKYSNSISYLMGLLDAYIDTDESLIEELFKAYCDESIKNVDSKYIYKYGRLFNIFRGDLIKDLINLYDYIKYSNNIVTIISSYKPKGEVTLDELLEEYKITKRELSEYIFLDSHLESELEDGKEEIDKIERDLQGKFTEKDRLEIARVLFRHGKFTNKDRLSSIRPQDLPEVRDDRFGIEIPDSLESDVDELL